MRVIVENDYQSMSRKAALLLASQVNLKPNSVLGLATGSTPEGMYQELVEMYHRGEIDFSEVVTFNLDEYYKLPPENEESYHYYMQENFFKHVNLHPENTNIPRGMVEKVETECWYYEEKIRRAGGIDLQVLGIGSNGHIGFNEPGDRLNVTTKLVELTEETIESNSRFFDSLDKVPRKAISVGMATILKARRIILLASGKNKAEAIKKTINGYVDTRIPSSLLQTHPETTLIIDEEAASLL
ncbi:glucosamine-6-phosphate deaminase [Halocella sp. SP3-1]|uniref:glucosamine-6-phosphate deaminase n=1 Tax=Halocella sp. SP3-1 TaxID=2382161 RepID=UPI000F755084|nr:glucosamine-6-phosphate deaminase [Halocella sp. SP3-1]AZO93501.1 glucosamine-6-phosphate deaminase [Halocella sp. SP3-1]MTI59387.1 glucosamine-6-phosphate deaminase [Bacillota bacterium]